MDRGAGQAVQVPGEEKAANVYPAENKGFTCFFIHGADIRRSPFRLSLD
jgi:hypothetical protein